MPDNGLIRQKMKKYEPNPGCEPQKQPPLCFFPVVNLNGCLRVRVFTKIELIYKNRKIWLQQYVHYQAITSLTNMYNWYLGTIGLHYHILKITKIIFYSTKNNYAYEKRKQAQKFCRSCVNWNNANLLESSEEIISRHPKIGQSTNRKCLKALSKEKSNSPNLPLSLSTTLRVGGLKDYHNVNFLVNKNL